MICCALSLTGEQCQNRSSVITDENLHVCKNHKNFTLSKKDHILKIVKENEFNKQRKEFIESLNRDLLDGHEFDIPLRNKFGLIIDFALVDKDDYEEINKYSWCKNHNGYAVKTYEKDNESLMHRFILGKPDDNLVIDHIDNNRLNNKRSNLRFVTQSENIQNKPKIIKEDTTSEYIGVHLHKGKNWAARFSRKHLGVFQTKVEAAKTYDTYVLLKFGKDARTNGLIKYDEITKTLDDFEIKKERDLPSNICIINNLYIIKKVYKNNIFTKSTKCLDKAIKILEDFDKQILAIKKQENQDHLEKEIKRNQNGFAIIEVFNKKSEKIEDIIVDDDKWHELSKFNWSKSGHYHEAVKDGIRFHMHRFLKDAKKGDIVDHINGIKNDNRMQNLRIVDFSINNQNRQGKGSSLFKGVTFNKRDNQWYAMIRKNDIIYHLGVYDKEIQAAIAVNIKAKDIYEEFAYLNEISNEDLIENLPIVEAKLKYLSDLQNKKELIPKNKYKGVRQKQNDKWYARIKKDGKETHIGVYDSEIEAALAYNKKAKELFGDKAKINLIS